jgi:subtilisin family serine protease
MRSRLSQLSVAAVAAGLVLSAIAPRPALAAGAPPADVSHLRVPDGVASSAGTLAGPGRALSGRVQVVVQLQEAPLALAAGAQRQALVSRLARQQNAFAGAAAAFGAVELARLSRALNAVIVEVDAAQLGKVAALPGVKSVRLVRDYEMDLSETVPYIGAALVQSMGVTGTGVTVAVLDSGIDYTHVNLGGPGTAAAYEAAWGTAITDTRNTTVTAQTGFPTAKVVGGFDFVGELWAGGAGSPPRTEDPNPIDYEGHGTHVADIIGGRNVSGTHVGVAPGVALLAVKVCSAVSTACNGIALLKGVDYALDPNGDSNLSDAADVINMSLGSAYGQKEDDLSEASANAVRAGVVVVASAGNNADRPYIVGSPSSTPEVLSVAQTQVPSAVTYPLVVNAPITIAGNYSNTATVEWAPITFGFTGNVAYVGRGCIGDTYLANPAGKVALIDRGSCNISEKVDRATTAGAIGVLVANNVPGDAPSFSLGNGSNFTQTLIIRLNEGNLIKSQYPATNTVNVSVSPAVVVPMVGGVVASSSRGPSYSHSAIKPDIGAPGASVSAVAGSGTGETAFGGTSGAAPMVSGAAALVLSANPAPTKAASGNSSLTPAEVKALLMNNAERTVFTNPATQPGVLAPITRIGGGEVRVDRAISATAAMWAANPQILNGQVTSGSIGLSFGYHVLLTGTASFTRTVWVRNYTGVTRTFAITPTFRYADDAASGAVTPSAPASVEVPGNGTASFVLQLDVDGGLLPTWGLNGGSLGGDGSLLQSVEFDGYLLAGDGSEVVSLPWHILPHKGANVAASQTAVVITTSAPAVVNLANPNAARDGDIDEFILTGIGASAPITPAGPGENVAYTTLKYVGARAVGPYVQFAIQAWEQHAHPNYPAEYDIYIDSDMDGVDDFVVYNIELNGFGSTGQNVVVVYNLTTNSGTIYFYADADLNSANMIMTAPLAALGLTAGSQFRYSVYAFDNYFTGIPTSAIFDMVVTLNRPRYGIELEAFTVPVGGSTVLTLTPQVGNNVASPSQLGALLMYRDAQAVREAEAIMVSTPLWTARYVPILYRP